MADATPAPGADQNPVTPDANADGNDQNGADPVKTDAGTQGFDPSKVNDDDFGKVFDDPRVFNHPRFKELNDAAKEAKKLKAANEESEKKALEEQGKWKELAEKEQQKAAAAEQRSKDLAIANKVQLEAAKLGIVDPEAALALLDRTNVEVDENGQVAGVEEAVKALAESKPYLVAKGQQKIGASTNPGTQGNNGPNASSFTKTQIRDPKFYRANEPAILEALKNNQIIDE